MNIPKTTGIHHIGLTVSNLEESAAFFTSVLGWQEVKRNDEYPAIYVSDGSNMVTLWAVRTSPAQQFNKDSTVGLHHLAFKVETEDDLIALYQRLCEKGVEFEFPPEPLQQGPARHMICYEPSGIRVEFIWLGQ